eukprot:m.5337 g.5337  ORF g.5337 m.5337 type:complete len:378 (+) comp7568_c0_seq2:27-1160(+)
MAVAPNGCIPVVPDLICYFQSCCSSSRHFDKPSLTSIFSSISTVTLTLCHVFGTSMDSRAVFPCAICGQERDLELREPTTERCCKACFADPSRNVRRLLELANHCTTLIDESDELDKLIPSLDGLRGHYGLCSHGQVPLLNVAVATGRFNAAEWLLKNGADPNIVSRNGKSCLTYAICAASVPMLRLLLENGANPSVIYRVQSGHKKSGQYTGRSPLAWVILADEMSPAMQREMIDLLVQHGADVNIRNSQGTTPLFWCAIQNRQDLLDHLIEQHQADVTLTTNTGETDAQRASRSGHSILAQHVETLLDAARAAPPADVEAAVDGLAAVNLNGEEQDESPAAEGVSAAASTTALPQDPAVKEAGVAADAGEATVDQ